MKKVLIIFLIIIIGVIVVKSFVLLHRTQEFEKKPIVIIHQGSWFGDAPFYLAQEKNFFEKHGVEVKLIKVEEPQIRRQMLFSGQADISAETLDMAVLDIGAGVKEKIFMVLDTSLGADGIIASQDIQTIADLKGKKVGATKGDPPYFLLRHLLKQEGIETNQITFLDMPDATTAATTFISGEIDAAGTWEPWLSKASQRTGGHILVTSKDAPGIIVDVAVARPELIQNRKKEVVGIMNAWFDAIEFWHNNPDEANRIMAKEFEMNIEEFAELITSIRWDNENSNQTFFGTEENQGEIFVTTQSIIDIASTDGMIENSFNGKEIIDLSIIAGIDN